MSKFDDFLLKLGEISDDRYIARLVRHVSRRNLEPHEVASLAIKIADSGFSLPASASAAADIPSTGGPSSLSTLVCPLFLNSKGFTVPKLGIPGRPAGGIDVLGTIPGYKTNLSYEDVLQCLKECQYAHFVAGGAFVPLDLRIFRVRQEAGAQDNPYLVAASLIAKKLAASVTHVRLDVRVGPHGNFGRTLEEARSNAMMFNTVARIVGLDSGCYLSDARAVYQPFIGRGEALVALDDLFNDRASLWLKEHIQNCWEMTNTFGVHAPRPEGSEMRNIFAANLAAQGSSIENFDVRVRDIREANKATIRARSPGYLQIDLAMLRHSLVQAQLACSSDDVHFPDPCGIELLCHPGERVVADQPIAQVRGVDALCQFPGDIFSVVPLTHSSHQPFVGFDPEWIITGGSHD